MAQTPRKRTNDALRRLLQLASIFASSIDADTGVESATARFIGSQISLARNSIKQNVGATASNQFLRHPSSAAPTANPLSFLQNPCLPLLQQAIEKLHREAHYGTHAVADVPPTAAFEALSFLGQAGAALACSDPPLEAVSLKLPSELLALIVDHCQFDKYEDRQKSNMTLALVSRYFYKLVRPRLRSEIHIHSPKHFASLARLLVPGQTRFDNPLTLLTLDLDLDALRGNVRTGVFPGAAYDMFTTALAKQDLGMSLKHTHVHCRRSRIPRYPAMDLDEEFRAAIPTIIGFDSFYWNSDSIEFSAEPAISEAEYANLWATVGLTKRSRSTSLYIDADALRPPPQWRQLDHIDAVPPVPGMANPRILTTLAVPHQEFTSATLIALLSPATPTLTRLDFTLSVPLDPPPLLREKHFDPLFSYLAPTLESLTLRIHHPFPDPIYPLNVAQSELGQSLSQLTKLKKLELGGAEIAAEVVSHLALSLPNLHLLTFLPHWNRYSLNDSLTDFLGDLDDGAYPALRDVRVCLPMKLTEADLAYHIKTLFGPARVRTREHGMGIRVTIDPRVERDPRH
ncbi:hypothetical protein JCM11641_002304 [Rhodosporidiobolus odoratus]